MISNKKNYLAKGTINKFDGEFAFLSNFFPSEIIFDKHFAGFAPTVEHAFQAAKTLNTSDAIKILSASTPGRAKRLGRKVELRSDWEEIKENKMREFLCKKFAIPELRERLLATGDAWLIEGNDWHDCTWGVCMCDRCGGIGQNKLGKLLMDIRKEIRENS